MAPSPIPPNDPNHPRWLLALDEWRVYPYSEVAEKVKAQGYGIVSYTWGRFAVSYTKVGRPDGIDWEIPVMKSGSFTLNDAKQAMKKIGKCYIWWDWMCVPQGKQGQLTPELEKVQGEEVAKQMAIYEGGKKNSIVWLHETVWQAGSTLESWLKGTLPPATDIPRYLNNIIDQLLSSQREELWLTSGWTLQEGALLSETPLLDRYGNPLKGHFIHSDRASVIDLTAIVTHLATRISKSFLLISEGKAKNGGDTLIDYITQGETTYWYVSNILSQLLTTGLVAYAAKEPLYILAGKKSRKFTKTQDECWALVGALKMDVQVDYNIPLCQIKERFFFALLAKYGWELFLIPSLSSNSPHALWEELFVDGSFVPLGLFFKAYFIPGLPKISWWPRAPKQPRSYIVLGSTEDPTFSVFTPKATKYIRRYIQEQNTPEEIGYVRVTKISTPQLCLSTGLLHIMELEKYDGCEGKRCIEIKNLEGKNGIFTGNFNGVVDVWFNGPTQMEDYRRIALDI